MAWTYSDYVNLSGASKLAQLRLHIIEVSNKIRPNVAGDGVSRSTGAIQPYLNGLKIEEKGLAASVNRSRFTRTRVRGF